MMFLMPLPVCPAPNPDTLNAGRSMRRSWKSPSFVPVVGSTPTLSRKPAWSTASERTAARSAAATVTSAYPHEEHRLVVGKHRAVRIAAEVGLQPRAVLLGEFGQRHAAGLFVAFED